MDKFEALGVHAETGAGMRELKITQTW